MQEIEAPTTVKAEQVRAKFRALLDKTNKENSSPKDVKALTTACFGGGAVQARLVTVLTPATDADAAHSL